MTRPMHEQLLAVVAKERQRISSRRGLMMTTAKVGGAGALALAATGLPLAGNRRRVMAQSQFEGPADVLNFALTLEHLETAFYRDGLEQFTADQFTEAGFAGVVADYFAEIRDHEAAHVETLASVITDLGGEPVQEAQYDFGYSDVLGFVEIGQALETTGVSAYQGAAASLIENDELLTAALTIHAVEARHSSYLNGLIGLSPFPQAVDSPLTPDEVLEIAGQFIVS